MLEKISMIAEAIRETWTPGWLAVPIAYAIWYLVEKIARVFEKWAVVANCAGQQALTQKALGRNHEALAKLQECLDIARALKDPWKVQVYLGEMAEVYSLLGFHKEAVEGIEEAIGIAQEHAKPDLMRRLTQKAEILLVMGKPEEALAATAIALAPRRFGIKGHEPSHPSHLVGALITEVKAYLTIGDKDNAITSLIEADLIEAELIAEQNGLARRLGEIAEIRKPMK